MNERYDVIVVGAGHAGIEAGLAAARLGRRVLMLTMNADNVGQMSCNPAIGGIGKGHLVREIDALGGEMGRAIDACGIQFRRLNTRKGPAVRASRAQADKARYRARMKMVVEATAGLSLRQGEVVGLLRRGAEVYGVRTDAGERIEAGAVVLTTGTFLEGLMHLGSQTKSGGRASDRAAHGLSRELRELGLELGRLKTGTCPRLDARSIAFDRLEQQPGDDPRPRFSFDEPGASLPQVCCYITHTTPATHCVIKENIKSSGIFSGQIKSRGPRYCPSIEDKVVRFPERDGHRIFLEPEGLDTIEIYPNGLSTALPLAIQKEFLATIPGLERAVVVRPGYAIEYDYVVPTQLDRDLSVRGFRGLYFAGQVNGTTGYEEAAAQGLVAGVNAARRLCGMGPLLLGRSEAYIGVLIDDLVTRGIDGEPYRMFTSRAEYRLLLREDNADLRLAEQALAVGLLSEKRQQALHRKRRLLEQAERDLASTVVPSGEAANQTFLAAGHPPLERSLTAGELLRRPGASYALVAELAGLVRYDSEVEEQLEIRARYHGYIQRQTTEIERMRGLERAALPPEIDYAMVAGLSHEAREKLLRVRPQSLGQASRISGLTPAAITALAIHLKKRRAT